MYGSGEGEREGETQRGQRQRVRNLKGMILFFWLAFRFLIILLVFWPHHLAFLQKGKAATIILYCQFVNEMKNQCTKANFQLYSVF